MMARSSPGILIVCCGSPMKVERTDWTEVAVAPDQIVAEMWQEFLADNAIPSMLEPGDIASFLGISTRPVRLLVPENAVERAEQLIEEFEAEEVDPEALAAEAESAVPEGE